MNRVSVVVVTHNSAATVGRCLASLPSAFFFTPFDVCVVDTQSADDTRAVVGRASRKRVVPILSSENRGFAYAANLGAAHATGHLLLFLNPDAALSLGDGERLAQLCLHPRVVAVSGTLVDDVGAPEVSGEPFPSLSWYIRRRFPGQRPLPPTPYPLSPRPISVPWLSGAALLVRAEAFRAIGGFHEGYFLYYEDVDLSRRLRSRGGSLLLDPAVRVLHMSGHSARKKTRLRASDAAEDLYFAWYRPLWERSALRVVRAVLHAWWGVPALFAFVISTAAGALLGLTVGVPLAALLSLFTVTARVPDIGAVALLASVLFGQLFRLPIFGDVSLTLTDAILPVVVGAWLLVILRGARRRRQADGRANAPWLFVGSVLAPIAAVLPGLLLAAERLPAADWFAATAYAVRLFLLLSLLPLGSAVIRRPSVVSSTLLGVGALLALVGFVQVAVAPSTAEFLARLSSVFPLPSSLTGWDPHPGRLFSTWLDPNLLGGLFVICIAALLAFPAKPLNLRTRPLALGSGFLLFFSLMLTKSRTSLAALLGVLIVSAVLGRPWRRLFAVFSATALVLALLPTLAVRLGSVNLLDPTTALRVVSWRQAIAQSERAPLFGLGYNAYGTEQLAVGNIGDLRLHSRAGADNSLLTFLATTGVWGLSILGTLLLTLFWALVRRSPPTPYTRHPTPSLWLPRAALLALVGLVLHSQFVQSLTYVHLAVPLVLLLGAAFAAQDPPVRSVSTQAGPPCLAATRPRPT